MVDDKKRFYEKIAEDSLRDLKSRKGVKTSRNAQTRRDVKKQNYTSKNNNHTRITKNGMIKFDEQPNSQLRSKFFIQCIICVLIIGVFYYLSNSNTDMANNIITKAKNTLNMEFNISDKIDEIFSKININSPKKNSVIIDDKVIKQMEQEIENTAKK